MDGVQISFDEKELERILDNAMDEVGKHTEKVSYEVASDTVKLLEIRSPRRPGGGEYANGWTIESARNIYGYEYGYIVWNEKHYRLTHLLEKGHAIRNQFGSYPGRVRKYPHIGPTEKQMIPIYLKKIRDIKF